MTRIRTWLAAACAAGSVCATHAQETYVTFDNFDASPISRTKYFDAERTRTLSNGALQLRMREYGPLGSSVGRVSTNWGEDLPRPSDITQLEATITVTAASVSGCGANPETSRVRARLIGTFFNVGRPTSGSFVGDVLAQVFVYRDAGDPANSLRVGASALVCTTSDCNGPTRSIGDFQELGTTTVGTPVTLRLEWDKAGNRIVFGRGSQTKSVSYGSLFETTHPGRPYKGIVLRTDLENCTGTTPTTGDISALVDNIRVNASALQ
ncbi:MAG: hypothetical protein MUF03_06315 [Rubrivivax sp.]|jgi:hypothetical protein|nr:hypothetical protein [Rubrivivax sp.]